MADKIVYGVDSIDNTLWEDFVKNHYEGSVFQMPQMYRVFEATHNYNPVVVGCVDESGSIKAIMLGVRICNGKGIICKLSARVIVWGGPLVKNNDRACTAKIVKAFSDRVKNECVYAEIRNLYAVDDEIKKVFGSLGFGYNPHLNIVVDLKEEEDILFNKLASAKRRNVKKGISKGLGFDEIENKKELHLAYDILKEVYGKTEVPLSHFSLFKAVFDILAPVNLCKFYKVKHDDKIAGIMVVLIFNDRMYEWYVGSKKEFYAFRPNEFLVWNTILGAKKEGLHFFDFGGAGESDKEYGVRDFKKGFGGDVIETGRFRKVYKKLPWLFGNAAIRMKKLFVKI